MRRSVASAAACVSAAGAATAYTWVPRRTTQCCPTPTTQARPQPPVNLARVPLERLLAEIEKRADGVEPFDPAHYPGGLNSMFFAEDAGASFGARFENPETRDIAANVAPIVALVSQWINSANPVVLDVGSGTGLMLDALNSAVAGRSGRVVALELSPVFEKHLNRRVVAESLTHVRVKRCTDLDLGQTCCGRAHVADNTASVALVCDVYHHFEYPAAMLRALRRALKQGGRLVVIDFHRDEEKIKSHPPGWITAHVRADQATFTKEIEAAGFSLVEEVAIPTLAENYCLVFEKK